MKKFLQVIILLFLCSAFSQNQNEIVKKYHSNGQLSYIGSEKDSLRTGKWKWYNEEGTLTQVTNYKEGEKNGKEFAYWDNGTSRWKVNFKNGEPHGKFVDYNGKGEVWKKGNFYIGKVHGKYLRYYSKGKLEVEQNYQLGVRSGTWKSYYENGQIKDVKHYDNDKLIGISVDYYENGAVARKKEYKDGLVWNILELNGSSGNPLLIGTLKNGFGTSYTYSLEEEEGKEEKVVDRIITYKDGIAIEDRKIDRYDAREIYVINYKNNPELRKRILERELKGERINLARKDRELEQQFEREFAEKKEIAKQKERDEKARRKTTSTSDNKVVRSKLTHEQLAKSYGIKYSKPNKDESWRYKRYDYSKNRKTTSTSSSGTYKYTSSKYKYHYMAISGGLEMNNENENARLFTPVFYSVKKPSCTDLMKHANVKFPELNYGRRASDTQLCVKSFETEREAKLRRDSDISDSRDKYDFKILYTNFTGY